MASNETITPYPVASSAVALVAVTAIFVLGTVAYFLSENQQGTDTTPIDVSADLSDLLVDRDNIPDVFTGQLVDIDDDATPDVALFGSPEAPIVRPLVEESQGRDWAPWAAVVGLVLAAVAGPAMTQWSKQRWPVPAKEDNEES